MNLRWLIWVLEEAHSHGEEVKILGILLLKGWIGSCVMLRHG